jgi:hypothetical protein
VLLRHARVELRGGDAAEAARLAGEIPGLQPSLGWSARFGAETLLARIDAGAGRGPSARARLDALDAESERSPSLNRRTAYLAARAALAGAEGRETDGRRDLEAAIAAIEPAGRTLELLELRLDLAALASSSDPAAAVAAAREIEKKSKELGLLGIAARARRLAGNGGPS